MFNSWIVWPFARYPNSISSPADPSHRDTKILALEKVQRQDTPLTVFHVGVSKNRGKTPQIIHLFIGFSIIFTIHFGRKNPYFWKHPCIKWMSWGYCAYCASSTHEYHMKCFQVWMFPLDLQKYWQTSGWSILYIIHNIGIYIYDMCK